MIEVTVFGIIQKEGKILLGTRNKEDHAKGKYIAPSGHVAEFETLEQALHRETMEEANVKITNLKQSKVFEYIKPERDRHAIAIVFSADWKEGIPKGGDDLADPKFYSIDEVQSLADNGKIPNFIMKIMKELGWLK